MEQKVMKYPIGVQSFQELITGGYVYVDKTQYIHQMVSTGKYYFLSRPRRFGKSLLISTMEAYFEGRRELFKGLAMEQLETEWIEYPVLHLDLNVKEYNTIEALRNRLDATLCKWEALYGGTPESDLDLRFENVIEAAYNKTGRQVVILIDEYDKPLLASIGNEELQDRYRSLLKAFYGNLKSMDKYIKFAFLTGVTKFSKVSVFSDLNNLNDISLDTEYAGICGITETELHQYFKPSIEKLAAKKKVSYDEMAHTLKLKYDGYRFSEEESEGVYNPFSLLNTFSKQRIGDYWFKTGTPTFLIELLRDSNYDLRKLSGAVQSADMMDGIDTLRDNPIPVLYQSGYLTIKDFNPEYERYTLGFPNQEVERGFTRHLLATLLPQRSDSPFYVECFVDDVRNGQPEQFMQRMETLFAGGNYQIAGDVEKYFQNCLFWIFRMMGFYTHTEYPTSDGRTDILVETPDYIYIIEVKLDKSAEEAMQQIEDKQYAAPYAMDPRRLYKIGINFSTTTRKVDGWVVK